MSLRCRDPFLKKPKKPKKPKKLGFLIFKSEFLLFHVNDYDYCVVTKIYIAPLLSEALPTRVSVFTDK